LHERRLSRMSRGRFDLAQSRLTAAAAATDTRDS
jgi:hypothetical protein